MAVTVKSASTDGVSYQIDLNKGTCTCPAFKYHHTCKHLAALKMQQQELPMPTVNLKPEAPPLPHSEPVVVPKATQMQMLEFDEWCMTRLSKNFIIRDFLYSTRGDILELANRPSDDPDMVIKAGKALCERLLEPVLAQFGNFAITYGYQSRELIGAGYKKVNPKSSDPHHWDRGTQGSDVYARVDILPYCVEDGEVSRQEFGHWVMHNLDIDLLMQWDKSNVYCITISDNFQRRVWLEWCSKGKGDGGSNSTYFMGEYYWTSTWHKMAPEGRPKFGPSKSGGLLYFKK
jgi:hypothetical protein